LPDIYFGGLMKRNFTLLFLPFSPIPVINFHGTVDKCSIHGNALITV
jgi:hypothetical protein